MMFRRGRDSCQVNHGPHQFELERYYFHFLVIFTLLILFLKLGQGSLENSDDGIYAEMARHILETGNIWDQVWRGAVVHERPQLFFWLLSLSMMVFGENEFAIRFVAALSTSITVILIFRMGVSIFRRQGPAALAALLFLSFRLIFSYSRNVGEDALMTACVVLAVHGYLRAASNPRGYLLAGAGLGLALMTKGLATGPVGLALLIHFLLYRRRGIPLRHFLLGLMVMVAIAAPWHLVQWARHGSIFWEEYVGFNVLQRTGQQLLGSTGPAFYLKNFYNQEGLLAIVIALLLAFSLYSLIRNRSASGMLLWLWAGSIFLLFSLAASRHEAYVMGAYPALALLAIAAITPFLKHDWMVATLMLALVALLVAKNAQMISGADFSPGVKKLAIHLKDNSKESDTLMVYNSYHTVAAYYSRRKTILITDDPSYHAKMMAFPIIKRSKTVSYIAPGRLFGNLRKLRRFAVLCEKIFWPGLKRALTRAGPLVRKHLKIYTSGRWLMAMVQPRSRE